MPDIAQAEHISSVLPGSSYQRARFG